jgi:hypothetical protein
MIFMPRNLKTWRAPGSSFVAYQIVGWVLLGSVTACLSQTEGLTVSRLGPNGESMVMDLKDEAAGSKLTYQLYCSKNGSAYSLEATASPQSSGATGGENNLAFDFANVTLSTDDLCYLQGNGDPNNQRVTFKAEKGVYLRSEPKKPWRDASGNLSLALVLVLQYDVVPTETKPQTPPLPPSNPPAAVDGTTASTAALPYVSLEKGRSLLVSQGGDQATESIVPNHPSCPPLTSGQAPGAQHDAARNKILICVQQARVPSALLYQCKSGTTASNGGICLGITAQQPLSGTTPAQPTTYISCGTESSCSNGWGWIPLNGNSCKAGSPGWVEEKGGCSCKC